MFLIERCEWLAPDIKRFQIRAPRVAQKFQPGQFVIVRVHDHGERIPLTIADADPVAGTITLIVQGVGKTTKLMNRLADGQPIRDVVGPLGNPSQLHRYGTVVVIGGGVGTAIAYPTALGLLRAGTRVVAIIGARTASLLIMEDEMRAASQLLIVTTDDGSRPGPRLVTDALYEVMKSEPKIDLVLAVGPIGMMRAVADMTRPHGILTRVSLNAIMVDGTGMCGGCRVVMGHQTRFACVDGPEFDAHQVDYDLLAQRNRAYREMEQESLRRFEQHPDWDMQWVAEQCRLAERHPEILVNPNTPPNSEAH